MYSAVSVFEIKRSGDRLIGYAAPTEGPAPCLLELFADGIPVSAARATRYSQDACSKSIRRGWCGIIIPGLSTATAIGNDIKLQCSITGTIIWRLKASAPIVKKSYPRRILSVFDILLLSRAEDASPGLMEIRPIVREHLLRFGPESFVNATFETFLGRPAEQSTLGVLGNNKDDYSMDSFLNSIFRSREFLDRNVVSVLPGPFNSSFKYNIECLDT